ncbi:MAG: DUF4235 domain-containing protein [Actinomycetota bacterium]|nr:DUF4235 domain-containing protein [Actinomycetota bacterium]
MAKKKMVQPDGAIPQKPTLAQTIGATLAGVLAVKLANSALTTLWRLATREDPPQVDADVPLLKKALWIGLVGAAAGAARQAARDLMKPPTAGVA